VRALLPILIFAGGCLDVGSTTSCLSCIADPVGWSELDGAHVADVGTFTLTFRPGPPEPVAPHLEMTWSAWVGDPSGAFDGSPTVAEEEWGALFAGESVPVEQTTLSLASGELRTIESVRIIDVPEHVRLEMTLGSSPASPALEAPERAAVVGSLRIRCDDGSGDDFRDGSFRGAECAAVRDRFPGLATLDPTLR